MLLVNECVPVVGQCPRSAQAAIAMRETIGAIELETEENRYSFIHGRSQHCDE